MKSEYIQELNDTLSEVRKIRKIFKDWERSKTGYKYPEKGAAYKNYLLIVCYGKIERIFKNIIGDYFTQPSMPQRCMQFGNTIREKLPGSMAKDRMNHFIKEECSSAWLDEIKKREANVTYKCKRFPRFTFADAYMGLTSLTNARHNFAHGESPYTGSVDDLIDYYQKSMAWLYEMDDIISKIG